jgi:hypothetical protein
MMARHVALDDHKLHEARLRRRAHRRGLQLQKPRGFVHGGLFFVIDPFHNLLLSSERGRALGDVEEFLAERA